MDIVNGYGYWTFILDIVNGHLIIDIDIRH